MSVGYFKWNPWVHIKLLDCPWLTKYNLAKASIMAWEMKYSVVIYSLGDRRKWLWNSSASIFCTCSKNTRLFGSTLGGAGGMTSPSESDESQILLSVSLSSLSRSGRAASIRDATCWVSILSKWFKLSSMHNFSLNSLKKTRWHVGTWHKYPNRLDEKFMYIFKASIFSYQHYRVESKNGGALWEM